jgi:putative transcriptional regulator
MKYHPDQDWLEQHAAGALPLSLALGISVHLSFCAECRRQVESLQGLAAVLMTQLEPLPVADQLFERIWETIETAPAVAAAPIEVEAGHNPIPKPLRQWIPQGYDQLQWSNATPGLRVAPIRLRDDSGFRVALHRMKPGGKVAKHDHRGQEMTLVLSGAFSDESGLYSDGDFVLRGPSQRHEPIASMNDECICLTIQEAPIKFTGFFWRWVNPFLK